MATNVNKKNLGKPLEDMVSITNKLYRKMGIAMIDKQHTECKPIRDGRGKIVSARYYDKATVDYIGRTKDFGIAFDCKASSEDKISLSRLDDHQKAYLEDWEKINGGHSFVIVSFKMTEFYVIPWGAWKGAIEQSEGRKNHWGEFVPSGLKHIKKEELPLKWKVQPSISSCGNLACDYLKTMADILRKREEEKCK